MGNSEGLVLLLAAVVLSFFHFMSQPIFNNLIADYAPVAWRGRSYGISFFFTFGLGSFSATFLGYIAEQSGTNWVFLVMGGIAIMAMLFIAILLMRARTIGREAPVTYEAQ